MSLSNCSPITVSSSFPKSIVGLSLSLKRIKVLSSNANLDGPNLWVYLMFANESVLALNSLNLCQHRIGRHRDIAGMYRPMLAFIQTNRDIEIKFHKSHTWTWIALVSPFLFTDEHSFSLIQVKFLKDMAFGGLNHFKVNSGILKLVIYVMIAKYFPC